MNTKKIYIGICFISSTILIFFATKFYLKEQPNKNDIVQVKGLLKNDIKVKKGKRGKTLIVKLNQYPKINFTIGSVSLRQTYSRKLINENKFGDSIIISISKKDYNRKISKIEDIPFLENYLRHDKISILEIRTKKFVYLSLIDYKKEHQLNDYLAIGFLGVFGLIMFYIGIKGLSILKTDQSETKKIRI